MRQQIQKYILMIFYTMWRRRYLIAVPILIMPILGVLIGAMTPKKYETRTTVLIQEASRHNPLLKDLVVSTNLGERMDALNALLHSRHILTEVAHKMEMILEEDTPEKKAIVIDRLSKSLTATLIGDEIVEIKYRAEDPKDMVEVLKIVSLRFVEKIVAPQRSSVFQSQDFLKREMEERRVALSSAEGKLAEYKSEHASELPTLHTRNVTRLAKIKDELAERRTRFEGALAESESLKKRLIETNPVIGHLESKIVETTGKLAVLNSRYTPQHSKVRGAQRTLESLLSERDKVVAESQSISEEDMEGLWNRVSSMKFDEASPIPLLVDQMKSFQSLSREIDALQNEVTFLDKEYAELEVVVKGYGEHDKIITELSREIDINQKIYSDLAERYQMAKVTGALGKFEETERIKMIDPPFSPTKPSNLPLPLYFLVGAFAGIFLGTGLAMFAEIIDTRIYTKDRLEELTKITVLSRVPAEITKGYMADGTLEIFANSNKEVKHA
jgi:polysaccharide chain length determinant protein (PEP-CTERM system associated)